MVLIPVIIYPTDPELNSDCSFFVGAKIPHSSTSNSFPVDHILILSPFLMVPSRTLTYVITPR